MLTLNLVGKLAGLVTSHLSEPFPILVSLRLQLKKKRHNDIKVCNISNAPTLHVNQCQVGALEMLQTLYNRIHAKVSLDSDK